MFPLLRRCSYRRAATYGKENLQGGIEGLHRAGGGVTSSGGLFLSAGGHLR